MSLSTGARLGPYEILSVLGVGGMGEVYRARDTKLNRDVALKVLPDAFALDADRLARFKREAQLLAVLNHPNIAAIYGLEDSAGVHALALELVEGPTLADRIASGPVSIEEALPIARQIAEALETAHAQGIIHRDLKPANIKVRSDGTVKVLDFSLAKAFEPVASSSADATQSPTLSIHATQTGVILGTAAYMAPEQAKARGVDKRADLWAFGAVLYEVLTGTRAFGGEDVSEMLAQVLMKEPDWTALPMQTPPPIRRLLRRCLEKDPTRRLDSAATARLEIDDALTSPAVEAYAPAVRPRRVMPVVIAVVVGVGLVTAFATWAVIHSSPVQQQTIRFAIVPPAAQSLAIQGNDRDFAISPDGTHLVYVSAGAAGTQLMVRAIDQLDATPLRGITEVRSPFVSPDGRWIGFFTGSGREIKKVSITGGPPLSVCRFHGAGVPRGASWSQDGTIVFATAGGSTGLFSVSAAGGEPRVLTKPDAAKGEQDYVFPSVLPGGGAVLFTVTSPGSIEQAQIAVLDLKTGQQKMLIPGGSQAEYIDGYLVYAIAGTLRAARFNPVRLEVVGDPVPVVDQVMTMATGAAEFSVSRQGKLVYVRGGGGAAISRSLAWVDSQGHEEAIKAPPRAYQYARLSPDGTRLALDIRDEENDIWIWDLARQTLTRLTDDPGLDTFPIWTPDSRRIIFTSQRAGGGNLFWQLADSTGTAERLTTSANVLAPTSISPDGTRLILREITPNAGNDLNLLRLDGPESTGAAGQRRIEPLVQTTFTEDNGELSPDGHWLAYQSNESGLFQVHVRPFPNVNGGHWQISTNGGIKPSWAPSGRELFYLDGANALTVVPVQTAPSFSAGSPTALFHGQYYAGGIGRTYDVSPDGKRFLMIKPNAAGDQTSPPASLVVVLNWSEELKARVPTK